MAEFNLRCQVRYPDRCKLPIIEKEQLEGLEKYKAFLMYQFEGNDTYLKDTIKEYFKSLIYFVYDADDIRGVGVKFCKICKLAQACDFGIAVLSPENENVFMEIGLLIGMGKPCLYVVNENNLDCKDIRKLPFDISDQICVKYDTKEKLSSELEKEVPEFMIKVQLSSGFEKAKRENVKKRIEKLTPEAKAILKLFVSYGSIAFKLEEIRALIYPTIAGGSDVKEHAFAILNKLKFINWYILPGCTKSDIRYSVEETYRSILEELLFSDADKRFL